MGAAGATTRSCACPYVVMATALNAIRQTMDMEMVDVVTDASFLPMKVTAQHIMSADGAMANPHVPRLIQNVRMEVLESEEIHVEMSNPIVYVVLPTAACGAARRQNAGKPRTMHALKTKMALLEVAMVAIDAGERTALLNVL